jgi:hypothetical protein
LRAPTPIVGDGKSHETGDAGRDDGRGLGDRRYVYICRIVGHVIELERVHPVGCNDRVEAQVRVDVDVISAVNPLVSVG